MFYRQAADTREQILREADRFASMRLALDRLAGDLRAAQPHASPGNEFSGDSNSLRFVKVALSSFPQPVSTNQDDDGLSGSITTNAAEPSDLVRVSYVTLVTAQGTNAGVVSALDRTQEPLTPVPSSAVQSFSTNDTHDLSFSAADGTSNSAPTLLESNSALNPAGLPAYATNQLFEPFADTVRFVRFRYWNGGDWQTTWNNAAPPPGVEIVLAAESLPDDAPPEALPADAFRRVVFLPSGAAPALTNDQTALSANNNSTNWSQRSFPGKQSTNASGSTNNLTPQ